jgi:hypothetical protein
VDDVDVGKPRLPWMEAGDGVGRATVLGDGVQRRSSDARAGAAAVGAGRGVGPAAVGGRVRGARPWAAGRRRGGGVGTAARRRRRTTACGRARAARRRGARARRRARVVKEKEKKKKGPRRWLFRITPVGLAARPTGVINRRRLYAGRRGLINPCRLR